MNDKRNNHGDECGVVKRRSLFCKCGGVLPVQGCEYCCYSWMDDETLNDSLALYEQGKRLKFSSFDGDLEGKALHDAGKTMLWATFIVVTGFCYLFKIQWSPLHRLLLFFSLGPLVLLGSIVEWKYLPSRWRQFSNYCCMKLEVQRRKK